MNPPSGPASSPPVPRPRVGALSLAVAVAVSPLSIDSAFGQSVGPASKPATRPADRLPPPRPASAQQRWTSAPKVIDALARAAESDASRGDWALARMYRLWNFNRLLSVPGRVGQALDTIAKRGTPLVRDHARFLQADLHRRANRLDQARTTIGELGLLTDGWLIGPFDNAAGGGHQAVYTPENGVELTAKVAAKGRTLSWRRLEKVASDGVIELSALLPQGNEASAYVAVAVEADRQVRAALRTGSADSLKVWINGQLVMDRAQRRFAFMDQDATGIVLEKGFNLILFKSSWQGDRGRLFARLT
ncbi:MAG: hypothetical protein AAFV29_18395, partial [Myxococcota bacterium]